MDALQTATRGMLAEWMAGTTMKDDALYMVLTALCMVVVVVHLLSHRRVLGRLASQLSQQDATLQQLMTRLNQVAATTANLESSQQDATPQQLMTRLNQVALTMANLESCMPPVSVQSGGGMPASGASPPGPRDTAMEQAVKELAGMHAQFFLTCEDIKSLCTTAQYTCDFCCPGQGPIRDPNGAGGPGASTHSPRNGSESAAQQDR